MERFLRIPPLGLGADLAVPASATSIVIFAHGSGSSRLSPRNRFVAEQLQQGGLATLLLDLLTPAEDTVESRFDLDLLAKRLLLATDWVKAADETRNLRAGYFGASTGGGAALIAAAQRPGEVFAVVSRGGRPDLAGPWLKDVQTPTLLLVGGNDGPVIEMNRTALKQIPTSDKKLEIIPGATHLFEEPGTLEQVAALARDWFQTHSKPNRD